MVKITRLGVYVIVPVYVPVDHGIKPACRPDPKSTYSGRLRLACVEVRLMLCSVVRTSDHALPG
jgi:hypothetical protein